VFKQNNIAERWTCTIATIGEITIAFKAAVESIKERKIWKT